MDRPQILLVAIATVFIFLTWATTLMRIYVKAVMAKHFGAEDYLAFLALVRAKSLAGSYVCLQNIAIGSFHGVCRGRTERHNDFWRQTFCSVDSSRNQRVYDGMFALYILTF